MKIRIFFILLLTCAIGTATIAQRDFNIPGLLPFELIEATATPPETDTFCPLNSFITNQEYTIKGMYDFLKIKSNQESIKLYSEVDYSFTSETDSVPKSKTLYEYDAHWEQDTKVIHNWDSENEVWVYSVKEQYQYDEHGNRVSEVFYDWDSENEVWVCSWKVQYEYDDQGNTTLRLSFALDEENEAWVYHRKEEYEYDDNGNITIHARYVWNSSNEMWRGDSFKFESEYDSLGNNILIMMYSWDDANGLWAYVRKSERIYGEDGKQTLAIFYDWDKNNEVWVLKNKREYQYDSQYGYQTLLLDYFWDSNNEEWKYSGKTEYEYNDEGKEVLSLSYNWDSNNEMYIPSIRYEYEYDNHGNMALDKQYRWDKNNDIWVLEQKYEYKYDSYGNRILLAYSADIVNHYFKYEYAYDLQGNMTVFVSYDRDRENDIWVLTDKTFYNYLTTHAVNFAEIDTTVDSKFEIPIQTSEIYVNENITSFQFDIEFDNSVLQYTGASVEGTIAEEGSIEVDSNVDGILSVYYSNSDAITGAGDIVLLEFIALASDTTTLFIADAYFNNYILKDITNGIIIIKDTPTTIPSITEGRGEVMIYPNPANNELFVTGLNINSMIVIYDLTGKQLFSVAASSETEKLDVGILKGGIYIIEVKDKESRKVTRFLKR